MKAALAEIQRFLQAKNIPVPSGHMVLGSGFGEAAKGLGAETLGEIGFAEIPGLPPSTVQDHVGRFRFIRSPNGKVFCLQMGRIHGYEGHEAATAVKPVMLMRHLGVKDFLLTNAAGGLGAGYGPGDVMVIRDHVNLTGKNPLIGENPVDSEGNVLGPRFPDLTGLYPRPQRQLLFQALERQGLRVHEGVYLGLLGPSFETSAEVQLFQNWGMHAVGMSTVWESIALGHSGANVSGISLISNLGAGLADGPLDHEAILETCRTSAMRILLAALDWWQR
jgi:purine-nucleoside phosphorylase